MMRRTTMSALAVLLLFAAGCGGDEQTLDPVDAANSPQGSDSGSPSGSGDPSGSGGVDEAGDEDMPEGEPFHEASKVDSAQATSHGLTVTDVRIGHHEGFDRVVFELAGEGEPGWRVVYTDEPREQGTGDPVKLEGDAALRVLIRGVGYPFDTGVEEYDGPREIVPQGDDDLIEEVKLGGVFEGQYDAFIGVDDRSPFRVLDLSNPTRIVIDVQHTGN